MSDLFLIGQVAVIDLVIRGENGQPADPGSLTLKTRLDAGPISAYVYGVAPEIVRDSAGVYHANLPLAAAGQLFYRWETEAPNKGAGEGRIVVSEGRFG
ncbi:MAG: hypothetical protein HYU74_12660 [Dechloromonas sp.]|nr:hypothetical protein [Dechloromonas sp.]